jgi:hypothetical protein
MDDAQKSENMSPKLARIAELAREDKQRRFFSIAHLLTIDALYAAFLSLRTEASAGVDGVTYKEYDGRTWEKIPILHEKLKSGEYRAQPLRRIYIPKEDGRQRPISIPSLEDKIVQRATVKLLNAIYEQDFLGCSYGFRPSKKCGRTGQLSPQVNIKGVKRRRNGLKLRKRPFLILTAYRLIHLSFLTQGYILLPTQGSIPIPAALRFPVTSTASVDVLVLCPSFIVIKPLSIIVTALTRSWSRSSLAARLLRSKESSYFRSTINKGYKQRDSGRRRLTARTPEGNNGCRRDSSKD